MAQTDPDRDLIARTAAKDRAAMHALYARHNVRGFRVAVAPSGKCFFQLLYFRQLKPHSGSGTSPCFGLQAGAMLVEDGAADIEAQLKVIALARPGE